MYSGYCGTFASVAFEGVRVLNPEAHLILLGAGKFKNYMVQIFSGGTFVPYKVNDFYKVGLTLLPFFYLGRFI